MCKQDLKKLFIFKFIILEIILNYWGIAYKHFGFFSFLFNTFKKLHVYSSNQILKLEFFLTNANSYVICFERAVLQCWYNNAKFFF